MATAAAKCRGFTHPVVLLIRSSIMPTTAQQQAFTLSRPSCLQITTAQCSARRLFATSMRQCQQLKPKPNAAATTAAVPRTPPSKITSTTTSRTPAASSSYAQALAQRPEGAVLYEGGSQGVFLFSCYMAGLTCVGGAAVNLLFNVYNVPPGVPEWTAYAFGSVSLMLSILGMAFTLTPSGVVRRIRVLPAVTAAAKKATTTTSSGYVAPAKIQIEVLTRRLAPIPGLPLKREVVEPRDVVLKSRMFTPSPAAAETPMGQAWAEQRQVKAELDRQHPATAPFRSVGWFFSSFMHNMRRGLTGEGFAPIEVSGRKCKLDITSGRVLEHGRAMDRILKIEEGDAPSLPWIFRKV